MRARRGRVGWARGTDRPPRLRSAAQNRLYARFNGGQHDGCPGGRCLIVQEATDFSARIVDEFGRMSAGIASRRCSCRCRRRRRSPVPDPLHPMRHRSRARRIRATSSLRPMMPAVAPVSAATSACAPRRPAAVPVRRSTALGTDEPYFRRAEQRGVPPMSLRCGSAIMSACPGSVGHQICPASRS